MIIKQFGVQELSLGEPVVGVAARLQIAGKATLGPPSEGLDLDADREAPRRAGRVQGAADLLPATDKLTIAVNSDEPAGGSSPISPICPDCRR